MSWWNGSWSYRQKLIIDNSGQGQLDNFTVLVKLTVGNFTFANAKAAGADIRFVDDNDTDELKYEIEKWVNDTEAWIWVKVPQIDNASNTDFIWMYWGNAGASDNQDAPNTWDANYKAVYHLVEAAGDALDSTGINNGNVTGSTREQTGQISKAYLFDGLDDRINCGSDASLDIFEAHDFTIEFYLNLAALNTTYGLVCKGDTGAARQLLHVVWLNTNEIRLGFWADDLDYSPGASASTWYYVGARYIAATKEQRLFWEGVSVASRTASGHLAGIAAKDVILADRDGLTLNFAGLLDEVRISDSARSADYFAAQKLSMTLAFITFGDVDHLAASSDTGSGVDASVALLATVTSSDTGSGADALAELLGKTSSDVISAIETSARLMVLLELDLPALPPGIAVVKVNGAYVSFEKHSLHLRSDLGQRISTAEFTIVAEEMWPSPSFAIASVAAIGGYTQPLMLNECKIDRGRRPLQSCAVVEAVAIGGRSTYLDHFFGGYIVSVEKDKPGMSGQGRVLYHCKVQDYNMLPMKAPLVSKSYTTKTEQEIIDDLFSDYLSEIDTTTYVESSGATITIDWTRKLLSEVLDELAKIHSREWYIDYEKYLHYFTPVTTAAPFTLSDQPSLSTLVGYQGIKHVENILGIVNRVTVVYDGGVAIRTSAASYAQYGRYFDAKIVDSNIDTATWANAVGDAILADLAFAKVAGSLTCFQEGLVKGQKVRVVNRFRNVDGYYLIQSVRLSLINLFQEQVAIEYGDYKPRLTDLLLRIGEEARKE